MELYSYKYAIPYLIFLGYLFVLMFEEFYKINKQQSTKRVRMLTMLGFLFFFGLRGFVYTDWYGYYPFFEQIGTLWDGNLFYRPAGYDKEFGFVVYSSIIKSIYPNYFFWVFISTAIDIFMLNIIFQRYVKYYVLAFILFFVFGGTEIEMNLMRNVKSILLFMLSLRYVQERKMLPYMLLNGVGVLFHFSSILYFPLYFILHREFSRVFYWIIFIVGNIIFLFHIEYLQPIAYFIADIIGGRAPETAHEYFRLSKIWSAHSFTLGSVERCLTFILSISFLPQLNRTKTNILFINLYVGYFICFYFFAEVVILSERVGYLFICSYWVLYPNLFALLRIKVNKKLIIILLIVYALMKTTTKHNNIHFRYDNLAFGIQKYEERVKILQRTAPEIFDRKEK
jgi:hypothetical protein